MKTWGLVCEKTLNRKLSLWEEFLQPLFCDRAKVSKFRFVVFITILWHI